MKINVNQSYKLYFLIEHKRNNLASENNTAAGEVAPTLPVKVSLTTHRYNTPWEVSLACL